MSLATSSGRRWLRRKASSRLTPERTPSSTANDALPRTPAISSAGDRPAVSSANVGGCLARHVRPSEFGPERPDIDAGELPAGREAEPVAVAARGADRLAPARRRRSRRRGSPSAPRPSAGPRPPRSRNRPRRRRAPQPTDANRGRGRAEARAARVSALQRPSGASSGAAGPRRGSRASRAASSEPATASRPPPFASAHSALKRLAGAGHRRAIEDDLARGRP